MSQQLMKKGWYYGLNSRFSNHYFTSIQKDDIKSRCGQINMKMLKDNNVKSLKLMKPKSKQHRCRSCEFLLDQDKQHTQMVEPFRY